MVFRFPQKCQHKSFYESLNVSLNSLTLHRFCDIIECGFFIWNISKFFCLFQLNFTSVSLTSFMELKHVQYWSMFRSLTWLRESFLHRGWLHLALTDIHRMIERLSDGTTKVETTAKERNNRLADGNIWKLFHSMGLIYSISCKLLVISTSLNYQQWQFSGKFSWQALKNFN